MTSAAEPRISAIVAAYNVAGYISQCVESLLAAEGCAMEVIVVDDASTDSTVATVRERFGEDARVRLICLDVNGGPSRARNVAKRAATGEWLAVVDGDDWCEKERFAELVAVAHEFDADVVSDDQHIIEDGSEAPWTTMNRLMNWTQDAAQPLSFERFLRSRHIVKPLIRRRFVEAHDISFCEGIRHGEDFLFFSELLLAGAKWHMITTPMYYYRLRSGALTNTGAFAEDNMRALQRLLSLESIANNPRYADLCRRALEGCQRDGKIRATRKALRMLDLHQAGRLLAEDGSLLWSILRRELSLLPLRLRRRAHRLRFG